MPDLSPSITCRSDATRLALGSSLVRRAAEARDLICALDSAHWNVAASMPPPNPAEPPAHMEYVLHHKADLMPPYHLLFAEIRGIMDDSALDKLAELARVLGVPVPGTLQAAARLSTLPPYPEGVMTGGDHIRAIALRLAIFIGRLRATMALAGKLDEQDVVSKISDFSAALKTEGWFLLASLPDGGKTEMDAACVELAPKPGAPAPPPP